MPSRPASAAVTVIAVHPAVVVVESASKRIEFPADWFPTPPKVGQVWRLDLAHDPTEGEKVQRLNKYLVRD